MAIMNMSTLSHTRTRQLCTQPSLVGPDIDLNRPILVDTVVYGSNLKDWRRRIQTGRDATTSLTGVRTRYHPGSFNELTFQMNALGCTQNRRNHVTGDCVHPNMFTTVLALYSPVITEADNSAKRGVVSRIKPVFDTGTFLGELHQTLKLIRDPAQQLRNSIDDYLAAVKRLGSRRAGAKALASKYLEYAFGWVPLIADIDDGLKAINLLQKVPSRRYESFRVIGSSQITGAFANFSVNGVLSDRYAVRGFDKVTATVVFRGLYEATPGANRRTAQNLLGYNPVDFVPSAYNLLPWSFLVDYFTNIGDIIDAWSVGRRNIRWVNRTLIYDYERIFSQFVFPDPGAGPPAYFVSMASSSNPRNVIRQRQVFRASYTNNFIPSFAWELPGILSRKTLNIAALATKLL